MDSRSDALLRLALVHGIGPITAYRLLAEVEHPAELFRWSMERLSTIDGMGAVRARRLADPAGEAAVAEERAQCHQHGIRLITLDDEGYPKALRELHDPPLVLWVRGEYQERDRLAITVVGPRKPSAYGHRQARRFSVGLSRLGATIVSGLACGIDTIAHEGALAGGGRTVAVLGSGFGKLYPEENRGLVERIVDGHGAVFSEFPFATRPSTGTFPRRNRLVAALSIATLVIEAGERSGSLITARLAGELGRSVFVLPGPIDRPEHVGSNGLIRDGATLVTRLEDLIDELEPLRLVAQVADGVPRAEEHPRLIALSSRERDLYQLLSDEARTVDDLVRTSGFPASSVAATLLSLELRRLARKTAGGYCRAV